MNNPITFTPEEIGLVADQKFFRTKAVITKKVRGVLDAIYAGLKEDVKWGHHFVFALILEGQGLRQYKQNLINRFHRVAGRELSLCLGPSLWDWKEGEGYTLPLTHQRKSEVGAVLSNRPFFKRARFVRPDDPAVREGRVPEIARQAFRDLLPVITA